MTVRIHREVLRIACWYVRLNCDARRMEAVNPHHAFALRIAACRLYDNSTPPLRPHLDTVKRIMEIDPAGDVGTVLMRASLLL